MSDRPVLINAGAGWRLDVPWRGRGKAFMQPMPVTSVRIKRLMAQGLDTMDIAVMHGTTEAVIWNALARAGA